MKTVNKFIKIFKFLIVLLRERKELVEMLSQSLRECKFRIMGISRKFYCQSEFEERYKCKYQCDHCEIYYKPLEKERGWK